MAKHSSVVKYSDFSWNRNYSQMRFRESVKGYRDKLEKHNREIENVKPLENT